MAGLGWYPCGRLRPATRIPPDNFYGCFIYTYIYVCMYIYIYIYIYMHSHMKMQVFERSSK